MTLPTTLALRLMPEKIGQIGNARRRINPIASVLAALVPFLCRGLREDETRWRTGFPAGREPWWPVGGLAANENAGALISMMARSTTRPNQGPAPTLLAD